MSLRLPSPGPRAAAQGLVPGPGPRPRAPGPTDHGPVGTWAQPIGSLWALPRASRAQGDLSQAHGAQGIPCGPRGHPGYPMGPQRGAWASVANAHTALATLRDESVHAPLQRPRQRCEKQRVCMGRRRKCPRHVGHTLRDASVHARLRRPRQCHESSTSA